MFDKRVTDENGAEWIVINSWSDINVSQGTGRSSALCPVCSHNRKPQNRNQKCLSVNYDHNNAVCNNNGCEARFFIGKTDTYQKHETKKTYLKPKEVIKHDIPDLVLGWLYERKITDEVIKRNKIGHSVKYFGKIRKENPCVSFPYFKDGVHVGTKYRTEPKDHTAETGTEPIVFGYDDIKGDVLIWVEGEYDKLAVEVAGFQNCVSVPNGSKSAGCLDNMSDKLSNVKTHIIAVDNDEAGNTLKDELTRRLNPAKCKTVLWPADCKDANDVLMSYGSSSVKTCINNAKPLPIKGIIKPSAVFNKLINNYRNGDDIGLSTGWSNVDRLYRVKTGQWTVVTGIPNHGKSEWLDALALNMIVNHRWKIGIFSPENTPVELHLKKFIRKFFNKPFGVGYNGTMSERDVQEFVDNMEDHLTFVATDEDTHNIDSLLETVEAIILREGINGMIIDPWNTIEHNKPDRVSETDYISSALSKITFLVRKYDIHVWIVAHPTKLQKRNDGTYHPPLPYDISGSAHWNNKCDNAITVYLDKDKQVWIYVNKIRFRENGQPGKTGLFYNLTSGRYAENPI